MSLKKNLFLVLIGVLFSIVNIAIEPSDTLAGQIITKDSIVIQDDNPVLLALDMALTDEYFNFYGLVTDTNVLDQIGYCPDSVPSFTDDYYANFLKRLDQETPFDLAYNSKVQAFIDLYVKKRRVLTSKMLGLQSTYFPMFEALLDKYELPLEFKYLAIVESALNPKARSRAGAVGLWQFMYATGKMYGLQVTSYTDDRMDPYKSTEAACKYFKYLYGLYGNWELVMAAYNCGPGNVNKAIRRSGGYRDYWKLYPFLPRETRGYVPAFIAVNYALNNANAHNLYPIEPLSTFFQNDTIRVKEQVSFNQISQVLEIPIETLNFLNPRYKLGEIPFAGSDHYLTLPKDKLGKFIVNDSLIYAFGEKPKDQLRQEEEERMKMVETLVTHKVKNGEYLGLIAQKYGVRVSDIKRWNHLSSNNIRIGQRLTIYTSPNIVHAAKKSPSTGASVNSLGNYYTMQNGDTLWEIAKAKGISYDSLLKLNSGVDFKRLKPGDKILITSG